MIADVSDIQQHARCKALLNVEAPLLHTPVQQILRHGLYGRQGCGDKTVWIFLVVIPEIKWVGWDRVEGDNRPRDERRIIGHVDPGVGAFS